MSWTQTNNRLEIFHSSQSWNFNNIITKTHFLPCNTKDEVILGLISYSLPLISKHLVSDHLWSLHNCHCPYHADHHRKKKDKHWGWRSGACRVSPPAALHPLADQQLFKGASGLGTENQRNHTPEITSICMIIWDPRLGFDVSVQFSR